MNKQLYLITFGVSHPCAKFVQPVLAENDLVARGIACRYFSTHWEKCHGPESYFKDPHGDYVVNSFIYDPEINVFDTLDQEVEVRKYGEYWK